MRENRGPFYLFTGLLIGLIGGLVFAWLIEPVQYTDGLPGQLTAQGKNSYRAMIALAFQADANLGRARQRLALLNDSSPAQALAAQAQQAENPSGREARALAALAEAYNPRAATAAATTTMEPTVEQVTRAPTGILSPTATLDPAQAVRTATPVPSVTPTRTSTITPTPAASVTLRPTVRSSPTLGAPFAYKEKQKVCDASLPALLQVEILNSANQPVAGVQVQVTWPPANVDIFYTGLAPDISPGYADFQMTPKVIYAVQAGQNGETVTGFSTEDCAQPDGSGTFQGGWKIKFVQP